MKAHAETGPKRRNAIAINAAANFPVVMVAFASIIRSFETKRFLGGSRCASILQDSRAGQPWGNSPNHAPVYAPSRAVLPPPRRRYEGSVRAMHRFTAVLAISISLWSCDAVQPWSTDVFQTGKYRFEAHGGPIYPISVPADTATIMMNYRYAQYG
jgi:hypothetical protein